MTTSSVTSTGVVDTGIYISATLGGGHVTAKNGVRERQEEECKAMGHTLQTVGDIDITKYANIGFLRFGDWSAKAWNEAQKKGDLGALRRMTLPICMKIAEFFLGRLVRHRFKAMLRSLKQQPTFVVSTQAFCLKDLAKSIYEVNKEKGWDMRLDVYLTDLPSKRATHFFPSVKRVAADKKLRAITTLHAPKPIEKATRSELDFWKKYCGNIQVVTTDPFPIRPIFLHTEKLGEQLRQPTLDVPIRLNRPQEQDIVQQGMGSLGRVNSEKLDTQYLIRIKQEDKVGFLMLGSQPTQESVLSWLKTFVQARGQAQVRDGHQHYFFLYCGAPDSDKDKNQLLAAVANELRNMREGKLLPPDLHIIPFTNQEADVIAPLMARSDMTITRSGGATSMELLQLNESTHIPKRQNKCTFIHSEALTKQNDARILSTLRKSLEDYLQKLKTKGVTSLTGNDWEYIQNEMYQACRAMGISASERMQIVQNIVNQEKKESHEISELLPSLMNSFELSTAELSKESIAREKKIQHRMKELRRKEEYKTMADEKLRPIATEKLLVEEGIILWEGKNARYLQEKLGANVVNPEYARTHIRERFFQ